MPSQLGSALIAVLWASLLSGCVGFSDKTRVLVERSASKDRQILTINAVRLFDFGIYKQLATGTYRPGQKELDVDDVVVLTEEQTAGISITAMIPADYRESRSIPADDEFWDHLTANMGLAFQEVEAITSTKLPLDSIGLIFIPDQSDAFRIDWLNRSHTFFGVGNLHARWVFSWYQSDKERTIRSAMRTVAHELTHVAESARQFTSKGVESERAAHAIAECVLLKVLGSTDLLSGAARTFQGAHGEMLVEGLGNDAKESAIAAVDEANDLRNLVASGPITSVDSQASRQLQAICRERFTKLLD